jgi:hypothetical protein
MRKLISLVCILVASVATANAQYEADALRFSMNFPTFTARGIGMGGAFTSLGGDFSSSLTNPAGLGLYRKSELVFSPGVGFSKTKSTYLGQENVDFRSQYINSNVGYVGTYNSNRDKGLVGASFAAGYNRTNNFYNNIYMRGENSVSTLADYFWDNAEGNDPESLDAFSDRLAFDAYVIDTVPGTGFAYSTPVERPVDQRKTIENRGGSGEWTFAFGLNFSNVFYVGMGFGLTQLNYKQTTVHSEYDNNDLTDFNYFHYTENLDVQGTGFTMRMGMMARIAKIVRLGGSLQIPTYYNLKETYYSKMFSEFDNGATHNAYPTGSDNLPLSAGVFEYNLNTPLKMQGGASVQIGKMGIVSAEVEYINYASMHLHENDPYTNFDDYNKSIDAIYRSVVNFRMGGEVRFNNLAVRLGGGYYPSAYTSGEINDYASYTEITSGVGYRNRMFFFDIGFSALFHSENYVLYSAFNNEGDYINNIANLNQNQYRLITSMGIRF